jgi:nucleoside transporter
MAVAVSADNVAKPPLDMGLRLKLSMMMFLQFAIWGSWFVILGNYLTSPRLNFDGVAVGSIYGTMALASIFAPLFVGQIADRFFASERLMGILHLLGAGFLYWMGQIDDPATFFWVALVYALIYSPTLALSNSIAFSHVPSAERDFPGLRVLGTIGWIAANWLVTLIALATQEPNSNYPFLLGAVFSWMLGIFSFMLPHTPPPGKPGDALPFVRAVGLFKDFSFAVFFGVSFIITIVLAFYYGFTGIFLEKGVQVSVADIPLVMTIGQIAEMILLPFLPLFLARLGMKWVLAFGMLCWGVRYALFAAYAGAGTEILYPLVLLGIALHGICFDFCFAAGFIHVDNKAPPDIRGSGQALFTFLTYGVGMWLGNMVSGFLKDFFTNPTTTAVNWMGFWIVPAVGVLFSFAIFVLFFRDRTQGMSAGVDRKGSAAWPPSSGLPEEGIMHKSDNVTR